MATSLAGAVLLFICLPELIGLGWCYIQIFSRQTVKRRSGKQEEVRPLPALMTNVFEFSSICESGVL